MVVSIHAPAKGATCLNRHGFYQGQAFQSTRPRRARHVARICFVSAFPFQSTRPRRARPLSEAVARLDDLFVSIHAPAKGATPAMSVTPDSTPLFQSTRPRRARLRYSKADNGNDRRVSIHAPAKGATPYKKCFKAITDVSIHAPAKGATCLIY